jgi:hypothetical protein
MEAVVEHFGDGRFTCWAIVDGFVHRDDFGALTFETFSIPTLAEMVEATRYTKRAKAFSRTLSGCSFIRS